MTSERVAVYEYEASADSGVWARMDKKMWLCWSGRRRLNGREYHGPLFSWWTDPPMLCKRQARVCPCSVCQQTSPTSVDLAELRAEVARTRSLVEAARVEMSGWLTREAMNPQNYGSEKTAYLAARDMVETRTFALLLALDSSTQEATNG